MRTIPIERCPDREALALRRALADQMNIAADRILAGNGVAELIWLVALAFIRPGDRVLVLGPTFGEYTRAAALMGAQVEILSAQPEQDFVVNPDDVTRSLRRVQPRLVFLCNPNNPSGTLTSLETIDAWARSHPQTLFIVGEAYLTFATTACSSLTIGVNNILVMRSMTKDYALAGLRLGYAVSHEDVIDAMERVRPPWSVNSMAQAAGAAVLADKEHLRSSLGKLARANEQMVSGLRALGLTPLPPAVRFFIVPVEDGAAFRRHLLRRKIMVRDCASFGLPAHVRIATRRLEENARLLDAIQEMV